MGPTLRIVEMDNIAGWLFDCPKACPRTAEQWAADRPRFIGAGSWRDLSDETQKMVRPEPDQTLDEPDVGAVGRNEARLVIRRGKSSAAGVARGARGARGLLDGLGGTGRAMRGGGVRAIGPARLLRRRACGA